MTANAMTGAREEYVAAGMNDYVSKPIDAQNLLARLARLPAKAPPTSVAAAPPPVPVEPPVDEDKLSELTKYLPVSSVIDLIALFTAEAGGHAMRIKNYLAQEDYQSIAREAHILVSTAGNIGAMRLSATARTLEHACKKDEREDLGRLVGELDRGIAAASAAFGCWVAVNQDGSHKRTA